jgi:hypothetical protein
VRKKSLMEKVMELYCSIGSTNPSLFLLFLML